MSKLTFTLEEAIPHYDETGEKMQMINFRLGVTWEQEEGQTPEGLREEVEKEFEKSRNYCASIMPIIEQKQKKLNNILNDIIRKHPHLKDDIKTLLHKHK